MAGLWDGHKRTADERAERLAFLADVEAAARRGVVDALKTYKLTSRIDGKEYPVEQIIVSAHEHAAHGDGVKYKPKPGPRK